MFSVCHLTHSSDLPEMGLRSLEVKKVMKNLRTRLSESPLLLWFTGLGGELGVLLGGKKLCNEIYRGKKKGEKLKFQSHLLCSMTFFHALEDLNPVFDVTFSG